jgi:hypothetical protein
MKTDKQNLLLLFGTLLIGFSFLIPNEFNRMMKVHLFEMMINNAIGFLSIYAFILIPLIYALLYFKKIDTALWISFVLLVFQLFSVGFRYLLAMKWYEYLINAIGVSIVILAFNRFNRTRFQNNIIFLTLSILYVLGLILFVIIGTNFDNGYSILLYAIVGYILHQLIKFLAYKRIKMFVFLFYLISLLLLTLNFNCNIEFVSDMGIVNWSIKNLTSRCSSFYCWGIGAIMINYAMILKYQKTTLLNK